MLAQRAQEQLRPQGVYSLMEVQDLLGIPFEQLNEAVNRGEIVRSLGEWNDTHVIGLDVVDWLEACERSPFHQERTHVAMDSSEAPAVADPAADSR